MATIDNLNFKVILDDVDFNAKIKKDIAAAKAANVELSTLLEVKRRFNTVSASEAASAKRALDIEAKRAQAAAKTAVAEEKVRQAVERTNKEHQKTLAERDKALAAAERLTREQVKTTDAIRKSTGLFGKQKGILKELSTMAATYFSVKGVANFLGSIIRVTGEFEMQRMALRNIVQDVQGADALFGKLQKLAVQSPYTFSEVTSYAKQLSAFSVPLDELYDTTKMLADVSAGLGVDMNRMILAYGQVRSAAFLRGQEVRQFTEAGVPLLQELAKQFTELEGRVVSVGEVFDKISKREVSFEMVAKVLKDLTSEGGKFFDMQSVLSETLKGKVMKLKDAYEQMLYSIGEGNSGFFHGIVDTALSAVRNYEDLGRILKEIVITFGVYKTGALIAAAASGKLVKSIERAYRIMRVIVLRKMNPYALLASGALGAVFIINELIKRQKEQKKVQDAANNAITQFNGYVKEETAKLDVLWRSLERAEKGTEQYDKAKAAILNNYGSYLSAVDKENIAIGELAGVYDRLSVSIQNAAKERFLDTVLESLSEKVKEAFKDIAEKLNKVFDRAHITSDETKAELSSYVSGLLDYEELSVEAQAAVRRARKIIAENGKDSNAIKYTIAEVELLREKYEDLGISADKTAMAVGNVADKIRAKEAAESAADLQDWQKEVNAALEKAEGEAAKKSGNMIKSSSQDLTDYIDKLRKSYKTLTESIANASPNYQKNDIEQWKKDLEGVEAVAKLLKIDLNKAAVKELTTDKPDKLTEQQKAQRAEIQATVQVVNKLKDAYERLKAAIPDSMLGEAMKALFPDISSELRDNFDYDTQLKGLADQLRLIPGEADNADKILANMGKDATKAMTDAFEAAERFVEEIKGLTSKDFALDGKGVAFDISKIVADLRSKNAKVDLDTESIRKEFEAAKTNELAMKALRIKYGEDFWRKYVEGGDKALKDLADKEKEYNAKKAQESVNDLAKRYVSENIGKGKGIDLTDLSQKSLRQVAELRRKIEEELENVDIGSLGLSQETTTNLYNSGLRLKDFTDAVKALLQGDLDKVSDEMKEKLLKGAVSAAMGVSQLGDAFVQLGEAMGNDRITSIGETMKGVGDAFANIASGAATGGVWGAIAAAAMEVLKGVTDALANEAAEAREAAQNSADFANALALLKLETADFSTVFGEATFQKLGEHFLKGREAAELYKKTLGELNEKYDEMQYISTDIIKYGDIGKANLWDAIFNKQAYDLDGALEGLKRMQVKTKDRGWFAQLFGSKADEHTALGNLAPQLWDEDGAFNVENAKKFLETNTQIDDTQRKELQNLVDIKEKYDEIQKQIDDMVSSLVGSLAGDMVDSFLDNFKQVGDAVDDLDSAFQNLGETILKSMLQSYVIDEILNEFEPRVKDMFKQYSEGQISAEDVADRTGALADDIRKKTEDAADIINSMIASFDNVNLIGKDSDQKSSSLSDGIKAVTEDTASLLASYINAIRADVSFAKTQRERVLEILRSAFPSSPTLAEHLAQIQANTYNTAVATQEMLSEFRGVLAPHSAGGNGVKVVSE